MADKPGFLRNLRIKRVALVEAGANFDKRTGDGAHIMMYKASPDVASVHVDSLMGADEPDSDYEKANLDAAARHGLPDSSFAAVWTDASGKKQRKLPIHDAGHLAAARGRIDQADIPANVKAEARRKIDAATKTKEKSVKKSLFKQFLGLLTETDVTKRAAGVVELEKAFPDDNDEDDKPVHKADDSTCKCADCMSKSVNKSAEVVSMQKSIDALTAQNVELAKAANSAVALVKAERETRLNTEMHTMLKSFKATPFKLEGADSDIAKFRKMQEADPEGFARTMEILKASDAQMAASAAFHNVGSGMSGESASAWDQIVAKADTLIEKSTSGLTQEQAIEKILLDPRNSKLVKAYRAAQQ